MTLTYCVVTVAFDPDLAAPNSSSRIVARLLVGEMDGIGVVFLRAAQPGKQDWNSTLGPVIRGILVDFPKILAAQVSDFTETRLRAAQVAETLGDVLNGNFFVQSVGPACTHFVRPPVSAGGVMKLLPAEPGETVEQFWFWRLSI